MTKIILSDPADGKSYKIELEENQMKGLVGQIVGKTIDGSGIGLSGYEFQITGGSDKDGFPMRKDVHGRVRPRILLRGGVGFKPLEAGNIRRKRVRGNVIVSEIVQINAKVVKKGKKELSELLGEKEKEEEKK